MDITKRRPAVVPASYPTQRYFAESRSSIWAAGPTPASVDVYRPAAEDTAQVGIEGSSFRVYARLTPTDLRRLASDLLDAADDIEQNPASALAAPAAVTSPEPVPA